MLVHEPKFSMRIDSFADNSQLEFARKLGIQYVYATVDDSERNVEKLSALVEQCEKAGATLYNIYSSSLTKSDDIHLAGPNRDRRIEEFQEFLGILSRVGVKTTTFTWEPDKVWSTGRSKSRGADARYVDMAELQNRALTHGREYEREELWDNFAYFMERIIPVAEETGVSLALHNNDPPTSYKIAGIPCIIHSHTDFRRAFDIAGSPKLGMEFCLGCWLEGGSKFGDIGAALSEFVTEGRVLIVHFRNVSSPLPVFTETFLDNGYMDMYRLMKILHETNYAGTVILDHTPLFFADAGYPYAETAYAIGYMRALSERVRGAYWR